ncbi:MAG: VWA domain-containing protein [Gemmataceae bacterium]
MFAFLETFLLSPWMLVGLGVLAVPPIIHLLNRRRFEVVDWGAMQFLQVSEVTRRRLMLEELMLMLLRMGLLGVLVLALAGPFLDARLPAGLGSRPARDLVFVLDGSASMGATDDVGGPSPDQKAREWMLSLLDELGPDDGVALLVARDQVAPVVPTLSVDRKRLRERIETLPVPTGGAAWPDALKQAFTVLERSQKLRREIILLGDDQKFSWADTDTLFRWELVSHELNLERLGDQRPKIWAVNLAPGRLAHPPNYGLAPLSNNRPVVSVDREILFRGELLVAGQPRYSAPYRLRLEVDGKQVRDLPPPGGKGGELPVPRDGKLPFSFPHRFTRPGSHLVSVILEADPPADERPPGYVIRDRIPGDNRQDYSVEVLSALPVLIVDGGSARATSPRRRTDFLRDALSPARDRNPAVQARVVPADDLQAPLFQGELRPRVVILQDVARLQPTQVDLLSSFVAEGGGLFVTLGERANATWYNETLYRNGEGLLPARLDGMAGDEKAAADVARPDAASFKHPVLDLFEKVQAGGLADARFPRWWKLTTPGRHSAGIPVGQLEYRGGKTPLLVERAFQAGRVLVSAVPLDNTWGTNLVDLPAFVPLAHEAVYYLAGARSADFNLRAGQPLRWRTLATSLDGFLLRLPSGEERPLSVAPGDEGTFPVQWIRQDPGNQLVFEGVREPGVYRLTTPDAGVVYYVVPSDPRESDLTPCSAEERAVVAQRLGIVDETDRETILGSAESETRRQEFWWILLVGLIGLLCLEVWMTRRLVLNR